MKAELTYKDIVSNLEKGSILYSDILLNMKKDMCTNYRLYKQIKKEYDKSKRQIFFLSQSITYELSVFLSEEIT